MRSCTIVTITSVLVRTPGVASRCSACSLRIASAAIMNGSAISRTTFSLSTAERSSTTEVGTSNQSLSVSNSSVVTSLNARSSGGLGSASSSPSVMSSSCHGFTGSRTQP